MDSAALFHSKVYRPFSGFGFSSIFFEFNSETILYTWIALLILTVLCILGRLALNSPDSVAGQITIKITRSLSSQIKQTFGKIVEPYFFFISALFGFILLCNLLVLIPGMEEPTKDINTTFAFGLTSFLYTQVETLRAHGFVGYVCEYCKMPLTIFPRGFSLWAIPGAILRSVVNIITGVLSFPLEALGKIASLVSLSLRLFGNIFGGAIIGGGLKQAISGSFLLQFMALISGANLIVALFFGLFEAFIQAFVFSVLSMTYIAMGTHRAREETTNRKSK